MYHYTAAGQHTKLCDNIKEEMNNTNSNNKKINKTIKNKESIKNTQSQKSNKSNQIKK